MKRGLSGKKLCLARVAVLATLCLLAAILMVAGAGCRGFTDLYPQNAYPYQGPLVIGTNVVHQPQW